MSALRIVIGISGASGAFIPLRILRLLAETGSVESHVVISSAAEETLLHEAGADALDQIRQLAGRLYRRDDIGAAIASGSFHTDGMIIAPCSMRTLAAIATGVSDNLLLRAADVHLKERRKLVLLARETPLHLGHLRNMCAVTEMGGVIMPPVPAFYHRPITVDEIVDHVAARAIDQLHLPIGSRSREWNPDLP
ncbi:Phenolic acid decarboxylase subunit B [Pseudorhizobium banfieldiae]|uniref:Flavin prenyltransferase UbiX n=1 Tax=Pseudorhizobium banfieldiae TaxID=1125847 RepID=L0NIU2_9HYPH|nr:UbiX family flavin prenyltransferase [Pseudorhizobium banfieldiae]CAD6617293.1 phenolic acid decarboxylase [arsenite-oxidising bacterium NT-25]CCF20726.1 Phenolic acid decarboxylase subunit B [Pseudorhizobium banfieldiae]